jgi:hypothetical protein
MKITLLTEDLKQNDNPGLDTFDPRFDEVVSCIESSNYEEAAQLCQNLFEEEIYDIRLVGYYCFAFFLSEGFSSFSSIFIELNNLLKNNFDAYGPVRNKEKQAGVAIKWLFSKSTKHIQHELNKRTKTLESWTSCEKVDAEATCDKLNELTTTIEEIIPKPKDILSESGTLLKELKNIAELCVDNATPPSVEIEEKIPEEQVINDRQSNRSSSTTLDHGTYYSNINESELQYSSRSLSLNQLIVKLNSFKILCQKADYLKAKIVLDDLEKMIENFKVEEYYPETFSSYFKLMGKHYSEMEEYFKESQSLSWQALVQLYELDPEAFLQIDLPS